MFTKNDLKTGMVVECKNGFRYMVITETVDTPVGLENGILISANDWLPLSKYNNDLSYGSAEVYFGCYGSFRVEKVYKSDIYSLTAMLKNANEIIWERNKEVDWSKVPVDTKVLVKFPASNDWHKRHFAYYKDGKVYTFADGNTSFTTNSIVNWEFAKLYKEDEDV